MHEDGDGGLAQRRAGGTVGVGEDGRGAAGQRVGGEVGAVGAAAGQGREQVAGAHLVRTQRGPGEPGVAVADDLHGAGLPQPGDHLGDRHGCDAQGAQRAVLEVRAGRAVRCCHHPAPERVRGRHRWFSAVRRARWRRLLTVSVVASAGPVACSREGHGSVSGTWRGGAVDTGTAPCWAR